MVSQEPVAIVGMGVFLPGASTVDRYWRNLVDGTDAVTEVPPHRYDPGFHGRDGAAPDRTHGRRGGFTADTLDFDPVAHGVPPTSLEGTEPDQLTALAVAVTAVDDAGGLGRLGDPERIGVVLGRGGYLSPGLQGFEQRVRTVRQVTRTVGELMPSAGPEVLERLRTALLEPLGEFRPETAAGLVPSLAAARVANRLDLGGPAYTVDAACASSLVAVDQAIGELTRGRCDVVLAGGAHQTQDDTLWSLFTQLGALSPSQRISPLSRAADGMLIGEGTAIVVLKRLADARRDGDRVYAVIRGSGTSSDGRGASLLSPSVAGQTLALRRAWAGRDPAEIGLLEAHGTATPAGDAAELTTVADVFGPADGPRAVIGSVKSMIGHTLPTAGVAGLVKVALALHHGVLPPTLHCTDPNPLLDKTRFRVLTEAEPWGALPRVAAVNAFGFGGVNAHVVLEAGDPAPKRRVRVDEPERVLRVAARTPEELLEQLDRPGPGDGPCRLGIVGPDERKLATARRVIAKVATGGRSWHGAGDVWCSVDPLLPGGKTVFVHPGLEADAEPRLDDVAKHFGLDRPQWSTSSVLDRAASVSATGLLLGRVLRRLEIRPDALAGHSAGEWTAMQAAGMYRAEPDALAKYWPDGFELPEADYLVLGCPAARVAGLLPGDLVVSHENAAKQTIVCGPPDAVADFAVTCRGLGIVARTLPFRSGFHTPLMEPHLAPFARLVADLDLREPALPVWSATTARPYPAAAADVRRLYLDHLLRPVRFRQLTEALHDAGFRVFVQVGAGQLGSFVTDTLGERRHLVLAAASGTRPGLEQLRRLATALWTEGGDPDFAALEPRRIRLATGNSLLSLGESARGLLDDRSSPDEFGLPAGVPDAIVAEFTALLTETRRTAADVVAAAARRRIESTVDISVAAMPYLRDHRFFRQRAGWPDESDFRPVVPATTLVDLACRAAERAWPGTTAVAVRDAVFSRWLIASPAQRVPLVMSREGDFVTVEIGPYALLNVELGAFAPPPSRTGVPGPETAPPLSAAEIYARREMFHGPAYQGLARLTGLGEQHIRGELVVPSAPGGLLDNVGQLLGCWLMATRTDDLLAFPRSIGRLTWHGPEPAPGTRLECLVRVRLPRPDVLEMDAELVGDGDVLASIEGWRDVRFPCDRAAHRVYAFPAEHLLGELRDDGSVVVTDRWPTVAARDIYAGIYLSAEERAEFAAAPPRQQRGWLLKRMAVKDAVRARLGEPLYPAEIRVHDDGTVSGRHRDLPRFAVSVELAGDTATAQLRSTR
ncbi:beta-ketoacyl synthase N-terminal-like domain-containing protein [Amycolatopsis sp. A133]|uniref:beta-ketoacyl synthase N-terminal-like domain-containing protein n=1 Tax=Amycolatopsis sp. A133 TaxID=3064472 RepID=UPI0027F3826E|nr:beta-ketoacyl synthase N-terminal-like domain-containing protein [Amycolatopsis sp. A133]MDQ7805080.1 beta-ketoacyl synthase N-terminal-like domain-containing protein [Amycolatopsis sp. A133]